MMPLCQGVLQKYLESDPDEDDAAEDAYAQAEASSNPEAKQHATHCQTCGDNTNNRGGIPDANL